MTTGRRELERTACPLLTAHIGEIGPRGRRRAVRDRGRLRVEVDLAAEKRHGLGEVAHRYGVDSRERSLLSRVGRTEEALHAEPSSSFRHGEHAADAPQTTVESELSNRSRVLERGARELLRGAEHGECDRQIEAGSLLPQFGRGEVDGDATVGEPQLGRRDPAAHALTRLLARAIGAPYFPLTPTFPWLGPLGVVPLPSKWRLEFGQPIPTDEYGPDAAEDRALVFELTERVRDEIQRMVYENLLKRGRAFI